MTTFEPPIDDDGSDLAPVLRGLAVADTHLETPPPDLWSRIEAAVRAEATSFTPLGPPAVTPPPTSELRDGTGDIVPLRARGGSWAGLRSRRTFVTAVIGAAAALVLIAGALSVWRSSELNTVTEVALSNEALDPLGKNSRGVAKLVDLGDGSFALDVKVDDLPTDAPGFYELWIIDPDVKGMYSLGPLESSRSRYPLPAGVDWRQFPIVDISVEPRDGVPTHSGTSVLRGVLA